MPGSRHAKQLFFDELIDLMERLSTFAAPLIIVGDFSIHVDDATKDYTGRLSDVLSSYDLQQHVSSASVHQVGDRRRLQTNTSSHGLNAENFDW